MIDKMNGHCIVCGVGRVGTNVSHELIVAERPFVAIDDAVEAVAAFRERNPAVPVLRPAVVSSLDEMLRTADKLRVEEVQVPEGRRLLERALAS